MATRSAADGCRYSLDPGGGDVGRAEHFAHTTTTLPAVTSFLTTQCFPVRERDACVPIPDSCRGPTARCGLVCLLLCGGLLSEVAALLRLGYRVHKVILVDTDPMARTGALHHVRTLHATYPQLLPASAFAQLTSAYPLDVLEWDPATIARFNRSELGYWGRNRHLLVGAGPPCGSQSRAGPGDVTSNPRHLPVRDASWFIISSLCQARPPRVSWLIEGVYALDSTNADVQWDYVQQATKWGLGFTVDSAAFGGGAHRLRLLSSNMIPRAAAAQIFDFDHWPAQKGVFTKILDANHLAPTCNVKDKPPYYPSNVVGSPLNAGYTLTHFQGSRMFRGNGWGQVFNTDTGQREGLSAAEQEACLGMLPGATAAPELTDAERCALIGNAICCLTLMALFTAARAYHSRPALPAGPAPSPAPPPTPETPSATPLKPNRHWANLGLLFSPSVPRLRNASAQRRAFHANRGDPATSAARAQHKARAAAAAALSGGRATLLCLALLLSPLLLRLGGMTGLETEFVVPPPRIEGPGLEWIRENSVLAAHVASRQLQLSPGGAAGATGIGTASPFPDIPPDVLAAYLAAPFPLTPTARATAQNQSPAILDPAWGEQSTTTTCRLASPPPPEYPIPGAPAPPDGHRFTFTGKLAAMPPEFQEEMQAMLHSVPRAFCFESEHLGRYNGASGPVGRLGIPEGQAPVFRRQYNLSFTESEAVKAQYDESVKLGRMRLSNSHTACPTMVAPKKDGEGKWTALRVCGDYRAVNKITTPNHYQLPTPAEIFAGLGDSNIFTVMDLAKGFNQLPIHPDDIPWTAVWGKDQLYECTFYSFGLRNVPALFQEIMDRVIRSFARCRIYVDDSILHDKVVWDNTDSVRQHFVRVVALLQQFERNGLTVAPKKCKFGCDAVEYLGHWVAEKSLSPMHDKVSAIHALPYPSNLTQLQCFLGMCNYYRKHIPDMGIIASPLYKLTTKGGWRALGEGERAVVDELKAILSRAATGDAVGVLAPADHSKPFILQTDWSEAGCGAVLSQLDDQGREVVIEYASKSNSRAEAAYGAFKGEALAVVWAIKHFHYYLYGARQPFLIQTDHEALKWLHSVATNGQLARWAVFLGEYNFDIRHRPGIANANADCLSRLHVLPPAAMLARFAPQTDAYPRAFLLRWPGDEELLDDTEDYWSDLLGPPLPEAVQPLAAVSFLIAAGLGSTASHQSTDIFEDHNSLFFIEHRVFPAGLSLKEKDRVQRARKLIAGKAVAYTTAFAMVLVVGTVDWFRQRPTGWPPPDASTRT